MQSAMLHKFVWVIHIIAVVSTIFRNILKKYRDKNRQFISKNSNQQRFPPLLGFSEEETGLRLSGWLEGQTQAAPVAIFFRSGLNTSIHWTTVTKRQPGYNMVASDCDSNNANAVASMMDAEASAFVESFAPSNGALLQ